MGLQVRDVLDTQTRHVALTACRSACTLSHPAPQCAQCGQISGSAAAIWRQEQIHGDGMALKTTACRRTSKEAQPDMNSEEGDPKLACFAAAMANCTFVSMNISDAPL